MTFLLLPCLPPFCWFILYALPRTRVRLARACVHYSPRMITFDVCRAGQLHVPFCAFILPRLRGYVPFCAFDWHSYLHAFPTFFFFYYSSCLLPMAALPCLPSSRDSVPVVVLPLLVPSVVAPTFTAILCHCPSMYSASTTTCLPSSLLFCSWFILLCVIVPACSHALPSVPFYCCDMPYLLPLFLPLLCLYLAYTPFYLLCSGSTLCLLFCSFIVDGVEICPSPEWWVQLR